MALVSVDNLTIGFRGPLLLDHVQCQIEAGQRIGLLGRNGAGKTTFMRMLCGQIEPDKGTITKPPATRLSLLPQDVSQAIQGPVRDVVAAGIPPDERLAAEHDEAHDRRGASSVDQIISRMGLEQQPSFENLSSGMKRRVLLAQTLVSNPDLLLLDEPTNHLDIEAIEWLEDFLSRWAGTLLFVTHDRIFLRHLATRILEIDRGRLFDWSCDYDTFLQRKEAALLAEQRQEALFDKKLAQEEGWIRQGIKARRTRNEGRVRALEQMRRQRSERRQLEGTARLEIQQGRRGGQLVAKATGVSFAYGDLPVVRDLNVTVMRGDKIGLIGPNGVGKTTLVRLLLGQLAPDRGEVRLGTNLQIAYFDQLREQLDPDKTVQENVGDGYDTVSSRHIIGYLQDFLFSPQRARTPLRFLSGGERNRVLLARLFAKPANVIVLDEPTNDLDTETLELLEARLVEFAGTVLLVSHDRAFLNNVVGSTLVFEGGQVREYVGGYDDWLRQRPPPETSQAKPAKATRSSRGVTPEAPRRLKYKEQLELAALPAHIEQLEADIQSLHDAMAQADYYRQSGEILAADQSRLRRLEQELAAAFDRWEELEEFA